ncbi:type II secretion system F family protein, partial [Nocardia farcinica]|uniref:type II secretion system F family protein n=1 Tax=Nocardia farcinica TaxID=37329 RepID=UPI0024588921
MSGICAVAALLLAAALTLWPARTGPGPRLRAMVMTGGSAPPRRGPAARRAANDPLAVASVFDLLAACLRAGLPMADAAAAVAPNAPAELGAALLRAADLLTLGADPATAWERAAEEAAARPRAGGVGAQGREGPPAPPPGAAQGPGQGGHAPPPR